MAKWQNDLMLDAALDYLKNNCNLQIVCSAQPTTYLQATSSYALADVAMSAADFTHADGTTNGRKTTLTAKSAVPVDVTGMADHVALCSSTGSTLLYVTTCSSQQLTSGNTVNIPSWKIEIADAA